MLKNVVSNAISNHVLTKSNIKLVSMFALKQAVNSVTIQKDTLKIKDLRRAFASLILFTVEGSVRVNTKSSEEYSEITEGKYIVKHNSKYYYVVYELNEGLMRETKDPTLTVYNLKSTGSKEDILDLMEEISPKIPPTARIFKQSSEFRKGSTNRELLGLIPPYTSEMMQFIPNSTYNTIDNLFNRMVNNEGYYSDRKIPHKECLFFYGPPGTGKTTLVEHMAAKYLLDIIKIDPACLSVVKFLPTEKPTIYLMEDIESFEDLCVNVYEDVESTSFRRGIRQASTTYSEFLNILDGVTPLASAIIIMTTNYPERLKPAVIRKGRVDKKILFNTSTKEDIYGYVGWGKDSEFVKYLDSIDVKLNIGMVTELRDIKDMDSLIKYIEEETSDAHEYQYTVDPKGTLAETN